MLAEEASQEYACGTKYPLKGFGSFTCLQGTEDRMKTEMPVDNDAKRSPKEDESTSLAMDPVYDALRSCLPKLRRHDRAMAELSAALELCTRSGDAKAGELLSEIRRGR